MISSNMLIVVALIAGQTDTVYAPAPAPLPEAVKKNVVIGKAKFKVTMRGDTAEVVRKNTSYNQNAQHFEMALQAAELASGCKAVKHFSSEGGLFVAPVIVILECKK